MTRARRLAYGDDERLVSPTEPIPSGTANDGYSSRWTCTTYSLPVSRRARVKSHCTEGKPVILLRLEWCIRSLRNTAVSCNDSKLLNGWRRSSFHTASVELSGSAGFRELPFSAPTRRYSGSRRPRKIAPIRSSGPHRPQGECNAGARVYRPLSPTNRIQVRNDPSIPARVSTPATALARSS